MALRAVAVTLLVIGSSTAPKWTAMLQPTGGSGLSGTAVVEAFPPDSIRASIQIAGAKPGTGLVWQIQAGGCEGEGPILGDRSEYPTLKAGTDGHASATVTVKARLSGAGEYSVRVGKRSSEPAPAACGRLNPTGRAALDI